MPSWFPLPHLRSGRRDSTRDSIRSGPGEEGRFHLHLPGPLPHDSAAGCGGPLSFPRQDLSTGPRRTMHSPLSSIPPNPRLGRDHRSRLYNRRRQDSRRPILSPSLRKTSTRAGAADLLPAPAPARGTPQTPENTGAAARTPPHKTFLTLPIHPLHIPRVASRAPRALGMTFRQAPGTL